MTIPAPFVSSVMRIEPEWIDYNGHLNVAYYNVLFDRAVDELYELLGLGPGYLERHKHSTMVAESHIRYLRELKESDPVRVAVQLIDYDAKRIHLFEQLLHADEGWLSATSENMTLHVDMTAKKVAPFPDEVLKNLAAMKAAHAKLPPLEGAGRSIAMPARR
jgi:acyl-CoA thioester hydrolase